MNGKQHFDLEAGQYTVTAKAPINLLLSINEVPQKALSAGNHKFRFRTPNAVKVSVDPSDAKTPYLLEFTNVKKRPVCEELDDEPPPQPAPPSNYLKALRERVRREMGVTREAFAEFRSQYELPDNVPSLFEEDEARIAEGSAESAEQQEPFDNPVDNSENTEESTT